MPVVTVRRTRKSKQTSGFTRKAPIRRRQPSVRQAGERSELKALQSLRTIFGSARTHDAEVRRAAGISGSQLWALSEIAAEAGITVNGLANRMALHQTTASSLVNSLVEHKFIRRARDPLDRRIIHLHPSAEGKRLLLRVPGPHAGLLVDALRRLDPHQMERLRESLAALVSALRQTPAEAAGAPLMGE
jgi:MarR family transcriptional regulator, organic hydroperoxide resistance regulator